MGLLESQLSAKFSRISQVWRTEARQARSRGSQEALQGPAQATAVIGENRPFRVGAVGCRQSTIESYSQGGCFAV